MGKKILNKTKKKYRKINKRVYKDTKGELYHYIQGEMKKIRDKTKKLTGKRLYYPRRTLGQKLNISRLDLLKMEQIVRQFSIPMASLLLMNEKNMIENTYKNKIVDATKKMQEVQDPEKKAYYGTKIELYNAAIDDINDRGEYIKKAVKKIEKGIPITNIDENKTEERLKYQKLLQKRINRLKRNKNATALLSIVTSEYNSDVPVMKLDLSKKKTSALGKDINIESKTPKLLLQIQKLPLNDDDSLFMDMDEELKQSEAEKALLTEIENINTLAKQHKNELLKLIQKKKKTTDDLNRIAYLEALPEEIKKVRNRLKNDAMKSVYNFEKTKTLFKSDLDKKIYAKNLKRDQGTISEEGIGEQIRYDKEKDEDTGFGKNNDENDDGMMLKHLLALIQSSLYQSDMIDDYIIIVKSDQTPIEYSPDLAGKDVIIVFLKDEHYTICISKLDQYEICYYNSFGHDIERFNKDLAQIQLISAIISPENELKFKYNMIPHLKSNLGDCAIFCYIFFYNYVIIDESFKNSTNYDKKDKELMKLLEPYENMKEFPYI